MRTLLAPSIFALCFMGCGSETESPPVSDSSVDSTIVDTAFAFDTAVEVAAEVLADAPVDDAFEASVDAPAEAAVDAPLEVGSDAPLEVGSDATVTDAATDSTTDSGALRKPSTACVRSDKAPDAGSSMHPYSCASCGIADPFPYDTTFIFETMPGAGSDPASNKLIVCSPDGLIANTQTGVNLLWDQWTIAGGLPVGETQFIHETYGGAYLTTRVIRPY